MFPSPKAVPSPSCALERALGSRARSPELRTPGPERAYRRVVPRAHEPVLDGRSGNPGVDQLRADLIEALEVIRLVPVPNDA